MESYPAAIDSQSDHHHRSARSASLFGTIKNIVTAPLTWFSATDDFEDVNGKRKPLAQPSNDSNVVNGFEDGPHRTKRMRMHSPERTISLSSGYLDPPSSAFPNASVVTRSTSNQPQPNRYTLSPSRKLGTRSHRTMSLEPSGTRTSQTLRKDDSMRSLSTIPFQELSLHSPTSHSRELSVPPLSGAPRLKMRSSATPQPSRPIFGRSGSRDDVHETYEAEPPSFSSLGGQPIFVRPPSERLTAPARSTPTLGTLVESQRKVSLFRQDASTHGSQSGYMTSTGSASPQHPNAAEKALHELDLYKTPLLPTRLRGSATVPEIFRYPKARRTILMQDDDRTKPSKKKSSKAKANEKKPYAGEGGMRKLLSRRRQEEEEEEFLENSDYAASEGRSKKSKHAKPSLTESHTVEHPRPPPVSDEFTPPRFDEGDQPSSFRVGRAKSSRHHVSSVKIPRNKSIFSATYDEEGDDDDKRMNDEITKKAPAFNIPPGFSFSKPDAPQILHDSSNAKEPPVPSLPFSLSGIPPLPSSTTTSGTSLFKSDASPAYASTPTSTSASATSGSTPAVPVPFSFGQRDVPATQESVPSLQREPSPAPAATVPNFFANSTAFKVPLNVNVPPIGLLAPTASTNQLSQSYEKPISSTTSLFGVKGTQVNNLFPMQSNTLSLPVTEPSVGISGFIPTTSVQSRENPETSQTFSSAVSASTTSPVSSFGAPKPAQATHNLSLFGQAPSRQAANEQGETTASTFATSAPSNVAPASTSSPFAEPNRGTESSNSVVPDVNATPVAPSVGFTFGQPADKVSNAPASTGIVSTLENKTSAPASPSPFSFGFGSQSQSKGPSFSFGASAKSDAPSTPTSLSFGNGTNTPSNDAAESKPFTFGTGGGFGRPTTPPKAQDQEVSMDESPTRDVSLPQKQEDRPTLGFSFGSAPSTGFGKASDSSSTPTAPTTSFPFGSASSGFQLTTSNGTSSQSTGFSFGQQQQQQQQQNTPSFSFGTPTTSSETPRPSTTGSFSFNNNTSQGSAFTFGTPKAEPVNPFSQQSGSVPSSPSTFNTPNPFTFGGTTSTQPVSTSFSFGSSQPSSPAVGNVSLPSNGSGFGGSGGGFGAAASNMSNAGTNPLFTIGAAPTNTAPGGARAIKKLPNRRGGAKR